MKKRILIVMVFCLVLTAAFSGVCFAEGEESLCSLSGIRYTVNGGAQTAVSSFDPSDTSYTIRNLEEGSVVALYPESSLPSGAVVTAEAPKTVSADTSMTISVTSADGTNTAVYTVRLRVRVKNTDTRIAALSYSVNGGAAASYRGMSYPSAATSINITLPYGTADDAQVTTYMTPEDPKASASAASVTTSLSGGSGSASFTITAEDGTVEHYTVSYRISSSDPEAGNTALRSLSYRADSGADAAVSLRDGKKSYSVTLPYETSLRAKLTLTATPANSGATVAVNEGVRLSDGKGTATIVVRAVDGTTGEYTITFAVTQVSTVDSALSALAYTVNDGRQESITPFRLYDYEYEVTLPVVTPSNAYIRLYGTPNTAGATVSSNPEIKLSRGTGTAKLTVTSANGKNTTTYEVKFTTAAQDIGTYWKEKTDALAVMSDQGTLEIDVTKEGRSVILAAVFAEMKGTHRMLTIDFGTHKWILCGSDIPSSVTDDGAQYNLSAAVTSLELSALIGEYGLAQFKTGDAKSYPAQMTLAWKLKAGYKGKSAYLYSYDSSTGLTYVGKTTVDYNDLAAFSVKAGGQYVLLSVPLTDIQQGASAADFADLQNHWSKEYAAVVLEKKLFKGATADTFAPDSAMTRGMFVTVLGRMAGVDTAAYTDSAFIDVPAAQYYSPYIAWAAEKGITSGMGDGLFCPDRTVTRQEMAVLVSNFCAKQGYAVPQAKRPSFADQAGIADWSSSAVQDLYSRGLVEGDQAGKFNPGKEMRRGEAAAVLCRLIQKYE